MTVAESFEEMPKVFNPAAAQGMNKTLQWNITGDQAGVWAFQIHNGEGKLIPGGVEKPLELLLHLYVNLDGTNGNCFHLSGLFLHAHNRIDWGLAGQNWRMAAGNHLHFVACVFINNRGEVFEQ